MSDRRVKQIAVILVSWNDVEDLLAAVESLAAARDHLSAEGPGVRLVVVFNGPSAVADEPIHSLWPEATLIFNRENLGYGPAANQGAASVKSDVLLFLNPDTRAEGEPFSELARGFDSHSEAVALAPRLLDWDGGESMGAGSLLASPDCEDQFTFQLRRLPTLVADARELLLIDHLLPNNGARRRFRYADRNRQEPFEVEQAAAAALAVRTEVFRQVGGFAEEFVPAWFEDVDLCARLTREGKILYWPLARFRHRGGVSSARLGYPRFLPVFYCNALRYRKRHYFPPARLAYRLLLACGMLLRLCALPLRRRMPRSRRHAAQAYIRVLGLAVGLSRPPFAFPLPPPGSRP